MTHPIVELQAADTMADQLHHRRENLAERVHLGATRNALVRWDQERIVARKRLQELNDSIEACETTGQQLRAKRDKLSGQLKTVIAVREAEALQHEIATVDGELSANEDAELTAMEEQGRIEAELAELASQEPVLRHEFLAADAALNAAARDIDDELGRIDDRRSQLRDSVDAKVLKRYDQLRGNLGVAAAVLNGSRCDGCHLDLSAAEVDAVRKAGGKEGLTECPQCGRLLVV